jgi:FKBP-type peptidyl-prolyl cis-trans isomerase
MNLKYSILIASGLLAGSAVAYTASSANRRHFVTQSVSTLAVSTGLMRPLVAKAAEEDDGFITTESGLRYKVITEGTGAIPAPGQTVKAHYTGKAFSS